MSETGSEEKRRSFREDGSSLWLIVLAPAQWAFHFAAVYAAAAVYCAKAGGAEDLDNLRLGIAAATLLVLAGIGYVGIRSWRQWDHQGAFLDHHRQPTNEHRHRFLGHAAFLLSVLSGVAVIFTALPALFIGACI